LLPLDDEAEAWMIRKQGWSLQRQGFPYLAKKNTFLYILLYNKNYYEEIHSSCSLQVLNRHNIDEEGEERNKERARGNDEKKKSNLFLIQIIDLPEKFILG
jgi:hypothetical protein